MDKTITTIKKNQREEIRVALSVFTKDGATYHMVSARVHHDDGSGQYRPGKNGLNVQVKLLPELVTALQQAEAEARAAGVLLDEVDEDPAPELTPLDAG